MPFERIDADHGDGLGEEICVQCGSALLVDPPLQELERSA
jgi:hypothetical protein